jgi:predicted short-subunit dehydrogenase-like oxidoreductase (DUF2520 family)
MTKRRLAALVCAGPISRSSLTRIPDLAEKLGPVKSSSLRVASRASNSLAAGYPVETFEDFAHARLIVVCVPDSELPATLAELRSAGMLSKRHSLVLCDSEFDSTSLAEFEGIGAATGSLYELTEIGEPRFALEGDQVAVHAMSLFLSGIDPRPLVLNKGQGALFKAAERVAGRFVAALLLTANDSLREAGLNPGEAQALVVKLTQKSLRSYLKSPIAANAGESLPEFFPGLARSAPEAADFYMGLQSIFFQWVSARRAKSK